MREVLESRRRAFSATADIEVDTFSRSSKEQERKARAGPRPQSALSRNPRGAQTAPRTSAEAFTLAGLLGKSQILSAPSKSALADHTELAKGVQNATLIRRALHASTCAPRGRAHANAFSVTTRDARPKRLLRFHHWIKRMEVRCHLSSLAIVKL